jgi:diadenylate cyclase
LVVSEETGAISYIKNGGFILFKNSIELEQLLRSDLSQ